ncbi:terminase small subunit [Marinobacter sp. MDS2]|uniref:terminase small subunit n=1 Tax=Marinobacter sp. MDS2 TaxID=3065961 RepID=UPI00273B650F|nr:terminase small subunit [Marinobacter sp. MDS2]MDP4546494.1 terminase small subunit [Marinobacter sp. MDS2]
MALSANPRESTKAKMREFGDLYRGGPDEVRGDATKCYGALHPRASQKVCEAMGCEYFNHPYTQSYLREKTDKVAEKADITQERVLKEIIRIGLFDARRLFTNSGHPIPIQELDDDVAAAIAGIKVREMPMGDDGKLVTVTEYKISDKGSALDKLMKFLGSYEKDNRQKNESLAEALLAGINRVRELDE